MQAESAAPRGRLPGARWRGIGSPWVRGVRRRLLPVAPYRIYTANGGSGSSRLAARLGAFARPDVWQPAFRGRRLEEWRGLTREPGALLDAAGYAATTDDWEPFHRRTDHVFEDRIEVARSIGENLANFCRWLDGTEYRVVFVHAAMLGLFSSHGIRRVTFLLRHPLHSLVSFAKPGRHAAEIEALGGLESEQSIELWAERWNRVAAEFLACRDSGLEPVLIRFEFAQEDARVSPVHQRIFGGFEATRRNPGRLSSARESQLRSLVAPTYFELYGDWRI